MSLVCIKTSGLTSSNLNYTQAMYELQNSLNTLHNIQLNLSSFDTQIPSEIAEFKRQIQSLQEKMRCIDRFVKESGYAYAKLEQTLYQEAILMNQMHGKETVVSQKQMSLISVAKAKDIMKLSADAAKRSSKTVASQYGTWNLLTKDVYHDSAYQGFQNRSLRSLMEKGITASGYAGLHLVRLSRTDKVGDFKGKAEFSLGNAEVSGKVHAVLFDNKHRFQPELQAQVNASVSAFTSLIQLNWHNDVISTEVSAKGDVGVMGAKGKAVINKKEVTLDGEIGVAAAHGEIKGQLHFFGATITLTAEGEVGAAGIGGTFSSTANSFEIGGKFSCLLGTGLNIKVDW